MQPSAHRRLVLVRGHAGGETGLEATRVRARVDVHLRLTAAEDVSAQIHDLGLNVRSVDVVDLQQSGEPLVLPTESRVHVHDPSPSCAPRARWCCVELLRWSCQILFSSSKYRAFA